MNKNASRRQRKPSPPSRSAEEWARDVLLALKLAGTRSLRKGLTGVAASRNRLRARPPASFANLLQGSANAVGLPVDDWLRFGLQEAGTLVLREKTLRRRLMEVGEAFGVDTAEAMRRVQKEPWLLCFRDGSLIARSSSIRRATGFSPTEWPAFLAACPRTLTRGRTEIANSVAGLGRILRLSPASVRALLLREPRLILKDPDDVASFLALLVKYWSIDLAAAAAFVVKEPKVAASGRIETMNRNVTKLAHGLGVDRSAVVRAVTKFAPLAYQKPERLLAAAATGAVALGVRVKRLFRFFFARLRSGSGGRKHGARSCVLS